MQGVFRNRFLLLMSLIAAVMSLAAPASGFPAAAQSPLLAAAAGTSASRPAGIAVAVPPAARPSLEPQAPDNANPSALQWIDGTMQSHPYYRSCFPEGPQTLTSEYVGYYGAT